MDSAGLWKPQRICRISTMLSFSALLTAIYTQLQISQEVRKEIGSNNHRYLDKAILEKSVIFSEQTATQSK